MVSCSTAAARNVSPAANITFFPDVVRSFESLAIEVVFPVPLTPVTRITVGPASANFSGERGCSGSQTVPSDPLSRPRMVSLTVPQSSVRLSVRPRYLVRSSSTISDEAATPISVRIKRPSNCSSLASSRISPDRKISRTSVSNSCLVRCSPCFSLSKKPMMRNSRIQIRSKGVNSIRS